MRLLSLILIALGIGGGVAGWRLCAGAADAGDRPRQAAIDEPVHWPVAVRSPSEPMSVQTARLAWDGRPVSATCSSCHATRDPNPQVRRGMDLKDFHQGLTLQHGELTCLACHNSGDYDTFRLAGGVAVERMDVMQLCAQCHGTQYRDYLAGAHGGMNGYWDLRRGPRQRNNCIDCHDPHAPAFQGMHPAAPPRDRFRASGPGHSEGGKHD